MQNTSTIPNKNFVGEARLAETVSSGVSWGTIFAGAAAAAALSLILLILGFGLGLSTLSPWSYNAKAIGISTIIWITLVQVIASSVGGYLAGRLRVKWANVHTDEVYFRDTAHGLLSWAAATLLSATVLTGVAGTVIGGAADIGTKAVNAVASTVAASSNSSGGGSGFLAQSRSVFGTLVFIALLIGAFVSSLMATIGGRQRDASHLAA